MKKKIVGWLMLFGLFTLTVSGQTTLTSKEMIAITPMVCDDIKLPADARAALNMKLTQMVSMNGFGSTSGIMALTANVVTIDKQVTATAPAQFIVELEVSVYIVDVIEGVAIGETSFSVKGVDKMENKAVIQAINSINARGTQVKNFMDESRTKLIDYYTTRIPTLMTKAKTLASQNAYDDAIAILTAIPENTSDYSKVAELISSIYRSKIDREAIAALQAAKGKITLKKYEEALESLSLVDPLSTKSKEVYAMIQSIQNSINATERERIEDKLRRYEDRQRNHEDQVTLRKLEINAARDIAIANNENNRSMMNSLKKWFKSKF